MHTNDIRKIKFFWKNELAKATDAFDYFYVGLSMGGNEIFGDREWAKEIFTVAINKAEDCEAFISMINVVIEKKYNDKAWLGELFEIALSKFHTYEAHKFLAKCISSDKYLNDKEWGRSVFFKARKKWR